MMLLLSLIAPLWHPVKDQLCLIRALATGGRIPGTNLILMPAIAGKGRFGIMEHLMMALAGGWLLFRVVCCKLADEDKQPKTKNSTSSITDHLKTDTDLPVIPIAEEKNSGERNSIENIDENNDGYEENEQEEELYYWGGRQRIENPPIIKFTRQQLDILLRLEPDDDDDDDDDDVDDDDDDADESEYIDMTDEDYSNGYPSTSVQEDDVEIQQRDSTMMATTTSLSKSEMKNMMLRNKE